jgi:uncharacterized Zn-binding protein involved in type VI secretion
MAKVKCVADIAPIKKGSKNVFANGKPIGRVGDPTCTAIMQGSRSVLTNGRPTARKGDANVPHCTPMVQAQASNSVFANGKGISRVGDLNTPHLRPKKEKGTAQFDGATSMSEWSSNPTGYSGSF